MGVNAFLGGGIALHELHPAHAAIFLLCNFAASILLAVWIFSRRDQLATVPTVFLSAVPTFLLAAFLGIPIPPIVLVLSLLVTYGFTTLVYQSKISQTAVPIYAIYLPILLSSLHAGPTFRVLIEFLAILPMIILFISKRFRVATSAVILSGVLTGGGAAENEVFLLAPFLLALVVLVIWYEVSIPKTDYSNLRATLDHGVLAVVAFLAFWALLDLKASDFVT